MVENGFPTRSCVFCRGRGKKSEFVRFVWYFDGTRGRIVWDKDSIMDGRGVYVHPRLSCWCKMPDKKHWARGFRIEVEKIDAENIHKVMDEIKSMVSGVEIETVKDLKKQSHKVRL